MLDIIEEAKAFQKDVMSRQSCTRMERKWFKISLLKRALTELIGTRATEPLANRYSEESNLERFAEEIDGRESVFRLDMYLDQCINFCGVPDMRLNIFGTVNFENTWTRFIYDDTPENFFDKVNEFHQE